MTSRKWIPILLVALAAALVAAGCGDDDDSDGATTGASTATTETETGALTATDSEGRSVIEACVESGEVAGISEEARAKIRESCEEAASGDPVAAQEASAEACRIVAEETLPEGTVREQALAACGTTASP